MKCPPLFLVLIPWVCLSQSSSSKEERPLSQADSLYIFKLIDSLMNIEDTQIPSQFALRVGYASNINASGSTFNFEEFGLTTRAAYYHKSGFFFDASGYWSNQQSPLYYLTVASLGYMSSSSNNWSFLVEYSRYIYNLEKEPVPVSVIYTYNDNYSSQSFRNSFNAGIFYQWKSLNLKMDYSLLTGDRTGHRSNPTVSYNFRKSNWLGVERVSFLPTFSLLLGIEQVLYYNPLYKSRVEAIIRLRKGLPLFSEELRDEFGVMNYAIRLPVLVAHKNWGFTFSYTYNFPKRLPGETAAIQNGGSLAISAVRYLDAKPLRKKA